MPNLRPHRPNATASGLRASCSVGVPGIPVARRIKAWHGFHQSPDLAEADSPGCGDAVDVVAVVAGPDGDHSATNQAMPGPGQFRLSQVAAARCSANSRFQGRTAPRHPTGVAQGFRSLLDPRTPFVLTPWKSPQRHGHALGQANRPRYPYGAQDANINKKPSGCQGLYENRNASFRYVCLCAEFSRIHIVYPPARQDRVTI